MGKRGRIRSRKNTSSGHINVHSSSNKLTSLEYPTFSLHHMHQGEYGLGCDKEAKSALIETLHKLGRMTWNVINSSPRHGSGYEKIPRDSIRTTLPAHVTEDVNFIAFRFYARRPMVGYRESSVFHILWLDHDFSLYDHGS